MNRQIAVVTGAGGGFGSAISQALLDVGYAVAAVDRDAGQPDNLGRKLGYPELLRPLVGAVSDAPQGEQVADSLRAVQGSGISVLVNNAGILGRGFCTSEKSIALSREVIDVNLTGAFNCTAVFARHMVRQKYGRIINIASVAGIWGAAGAAAYAASKAGLIKASESWARELGPMNICVTAIAPGICKTPMLDQFAGGEGAPPVDEDRIAKSIVPVGRWGVPDDVAEVVSFLATCKTNYLNAAVIPLDGGMRVGTL